MRTSLTLAVLIALAAPVHAQAPQSQFRSFGYARLGYGGVLARGFNGAPALGFGFRGEAGSFGLDLSGLNYMIGTPTERGAVFAGSLIKLEVLRVLNPDGDRSGYVGLGMSWGGVVVSPESQSGIYDGGWYGTGLQGELSAGYDLTHQSPLRTFVQADVSLPLFRSRSESYTYVRPGVPLLRTVDQRYTPSMVVSLGVGWDRHRP